MFGFGSATDKPKSPVPASGPDDPVCSRERDSLRRWRVAQSIVDLVESTPADWSLRIGVFGRWGEGKSSVLQFVKSIVSEKQGYVTASFNPWLARDIREMWFGLAQAIYQSVDPKAAKTLKRSVLWPKLYGALAKLAEVQPGAKPVAEVVGGVLLPFLEVTKQKVEELLDQKLDKRRLVVLIEDIDRADPALVPVLLLGLREALALKRCVFVVALDSTVVAKGLPQVHPGWEATEEFLEKVIDHEIRLSEPLPEDVLRLATHELGVVQGLGLDTALLAEVGDLLPRNPRRLKRFIRGLARFKPTLARCDSGEVQWLVLLLLDLMRTACPAAASRMFTSKDLVGSLAASRVELRKGFRSEVLKEIEDLVKGHTEEKREQQEFVGVAKAFMERAPFVGPIGLVRWARLVAGEPPLLTDKEARVVLESCDTAQKLSEWTRSQAKTLGVTDEEVQRAVVRGMLDERAGAIQQSLSAFTPAEYEALQQTASRALARIRAMACELHGFASGSLTAEEFMAIYSQADQWAQMHQDPAQVRAREEEKSLLLDSAGDAGPLATHLLEALKVGSGLPDLASSPEGRTLKNEIVKALSPAVVEDLLARFGREAGISSLGRENRYLAERYFLLRRDSPFFDELGRTRLKELARSAQADHNVQLNFVHFIDLLHEALEHSQEAKDLAADVEIIGAAWTAATSKPLRRQVVADLEKARTAFAELLGGDTALPLPGWWSHTT